MMTMKLVVPITFFRSYSIFRQTFFFISGSLHPTVYYLVVIVHCTTLPFLKQSQTLDVFTEAILYIKIIRSNTLYQNNQKVKLFF